MTEVVGATPTYNYRPKECLACGRSFLPNSGVQKVCQDLSCREWRIREKAKRQYKNRLARNPNLNRETSARRKDRFHAVGRTVCSCGCGKAVPLLTASGKPYRFIKGHQYRVRGFTPGHLRRMSESHIGKPANPNAIRAMRERLKDPLVQARRLTALQTAMRRLHADPNYTMKRMRAVAKHPNRLEQRVIKIIERCSLPYRYVGRGDFILGNCIPDFLNSNGEKRLIEVFGDYWHNRKDRKNRSEEDRKRIFAEFGFDTLILWEHDLRRMSDDEVAETIRRFEKPQGEARPLGGDPR